MYAAIGRPSIAPEKLLRASLLQAFFTVHSERLLMERLDYDLMFRWFVGLGIAGFVADLRAMCVTPHVAQKARGSAIDARTTRHPGYAVSIRRRKLVEKPFGWAKTIGGLARPMLNGSCDRASPSPSSWPPMTS